MENMELVRLLTETQQRSIDNERRLAKIEERQDSLDNLVTAVQVLGTKYDAMDRDLKEIKSDVKMLTNKPAKRWESVVEKVIITVVGLLIGYLLAHMGIS